MNDSERWLMIYLPILGAMPTKPATAAEWTDLALDEWIKRFKTIDETLDED